MFSILKPLVLNRNNLRLISNTSRLCTKEYTETEEWIYHTKEYTKMGLTKKAMDELNELVYIEYNLEEGDIIKKNDEIVIVESVKSVNYINSPFDCTLIENNDALLDNLKIINENPECVENSWIIKVKRQD